ncbi:PilZ domain-containing protein [Paraglaciecola sp.]|uniref:PilZ domain-containing protein n=1 Tax=Paraglaciecola sp. TaxID=1920173 RepID=UPI003EF74D5B
MANNSEEKFNDDEAVIKKYKSLINKLIPFQQENRLLEGINKFSNVLPSKIRNTIKEEVIRLTALTDASADNSEFAKFPVVKFKHFGIPMSLDKMGKAILLKETSRFDDRYTVGVFEAVMNSDHYQSHVKQEQQKKITKAFKVESQSFKDIDFQEDLAIRPNFTVYCSEFEKGKNCRLSAISFSGMTVETKRQPNLNAEDTSRMLFTLPHVAILNEGITEIEFSMLDSSFNKDTSVFETEFVFTPDMPKKQRQRWMNYIKHVMNQFPLERELELERALQNLERDRIFSNSPWIPVFLGEKDGHLSPLYELSTPKNKAYNAQFSVREDLPTEQIFQNLLKELSAYQETFLLIGSIEGKNNDIDVSITHRQLAKTGLLKQFIELATRSDKLRVIQFRLKRIATEHKQIAFDIHGLAPRDNPELASLSHVLFCKDVTEWVGNLEVSKPEPFKPFPRGIINTQKSWPIEMVMESAADRRVETRYKMDIPAQCKSGIFSQAEATLDDMSMSGLKLTLSEPASFTLGDEIKVSIKQLKLRNQKYQVVHYDQNKKLLRLKLPEELIKSAGAQIQQLFDNNAKYFLSRDISLQQGSVHSYLWELSIRNLPCASILVTNNRFTIDRLKTIYHEEDCFDLKPFSTLGNEVPLHGFFADKEATGPKSSLLDKMLRNKQRDAHIVHVVRTNNQRIIYVDQNDFLFGKVRNQISQHVAKSAVEACVSHISAMRCNDKPIPLNKKRLAELSKIDINAYKQLQSMQKGYTHVVYLTNVSTFHNALLKFGIYPTEPEQSE